MLRQILLRSMFTSVIVSAGLALSPAPSETKSFECPQASAEAGSWCVEKYEESIRERDNALITNRIRRRINSKKELMMVGQGKRSSYTFIRVVDTNSPIPGGIGNFIFFTDPFTTLSLDGRPAISIENGTIVFSGSGAFGQRGLYSAVVGGSIATIADTNTALPNSTGNFRLFGTPSISQRNVAFPASGEIGPVAQGAFFVSPGSTIKTIADQNTPVPGGIGSFRGIGSVFLDHRKVAFEHSSVGKDRIFVSQNGGRITLVADSTNFGVFNGLSFNDSIVAFIANQNSIFAAPVGSSPMLVVDVGSFPNPGGGEPFYWVQSLN